jgi:DNA-binding CsgD family transcriptional regulator
MSRLNLGIRAQAAREAIAELCEQPIPTRELLDEIDERVQRIVPSDCAAWWRSDPETLLPSELWGFDVNDIRHEVDDADYYDLDRAGKNVVALGSRPVGSVVSGSAGPRLGGDRLRILARSGGSSWGMACSTRSADLPAFTEVETRFVSAVATHVGAAIRASLARTGFASPDAEAGAVGTLILDADHRPEGATHDALYWLERLGIDAGEPLPPAMRWAVFQAHARDQLASAGRIVRPARVRMPLSDGSWLLIQADALAGSAQQRTALTLRPAGRAELLPLKLALYGLTPREAQVSELLIDGRTTEEIALALHLSRHTVRDHTKAVYEKVGVHSRPELTALFTSGARPAEPSGRQALSAE